MILGLYRTALVRRPLITNCVTSAFLFAAGDAISQHAIEKNDEHDFGRTAHMGFYGGALFGPACFHWYKTLGKINIPSKPLLQTASRVAGDQLIFAPINMAVFFSVITTLEGGDVKEKLSKSYTPALKANWMVWPIVQMVNFRFVPAQHRILFVNFVALGWNSYLAFINSKSPSGDSQKGKKSSGGDYRPENWLV